MEADFAHYYGIDLIDLYAGRLTVRRAAALAMYLPPGARVWAERGDNTAWSTESHLIAAAVDALEVGNWLRSEDGKRGRNRPKPLPRPVDIKAQRDKQARISARALRFLQRQRHRQQHAQQPDQQ